MTASNVSDSERVALISNRRNVRKWLLRFIKFLTLCIFLHFFFLALSMNLSPKESTTIPRESIQEEMENEKERELEFWVHRYLKWHEANRHNASRVAVYNPLGAGLGDNVYGMINLWGHAVVTNRLLLINFNHPVPLATYLSNRTRREFVYNKTDEKFGPKIGCHLYFPRPASPNSTAAILLKGAVPVVCLHMSHVRDAHEFAELPPPYPGKVPKFSDAVRTAIGNILLEPSDELLSLKNDFLSKNGLSNGKPYFAFHARLGKGVGEKYMGRFRAINYVYVSECAADRLLRISKEYGIAPKDLRVFLATDTPSFRAIFAEVMEDLVRGSRVITTEHRVKHFKDTRDHFAHLNIHLDSILLGDAREIIAFRSTYTQAAKWRGKAVKLHEMYYHKCPHKLKRKKKVVQLNKWKS